jgi:ribosome biogenesis protein BMS1
VHHPLQDEEETYYDAMKREMAERAAKTRAALDALDPSTRLAMEVGGRGGRGRGVMCVQALWGPTVPHLPLAGGRNANT